MAKPEIRVLLYTDDPVRINRIGPLGVGELCNHLKAHESPFAVIDPKLVSRNTGPHPAQHARFRLTDELLKKFDQVWFFGLHQKNKDNYSLDFPHAGGPRSELEADEIAALQKWMTEDTATGSPGIGVLMAGDHANPPPDVALPPGSDLLCPPLNHETFLGLGRAIGKAVPRAGELRKWEGPPTHCRDDNFNSQFLPSGGDLNSPENQADQFPQQLTLLTFDADGNPSPSGQPHELFRGSNGSWIRIFPDHDHEGTLAMPASFPESTWPRKSGFQPRPQIIARSIDRRNGNPLDILSAYNGHPVERGRIVADSSWHHYFNINLQHLSAGEQESADARQIGEYYRNLAFWLSPLSKRHEVAEEMLLWLATHPLMFEVAGSGIINVGRLATHLVSESLTDCQFQDLVVALSPAALTEKVQQFVFQKPVQLSPVEVLIGAVLSEYFIEESKRGGPNDSSFQLPRIIARGFSNALTLNVSSPSSQTQSGRKSLKPPPSASLISERKTSMTEILEFEYLLVLDKNATKELCFLTLFEDPRSCGTVGHDPIAVCKVWGTLKTSDFAPYPVIGAIIPIDEETFHITIQFRFRRVRIVASGFMDPTGLFTRFFAFDPDQPKALSTPVDSRAAVDPPRIDPSDGDTGTGTGTTTLVDASRQGSQDKAE